jgi:hypothetical protein
MNIMPKIDPSGDWETITTPTVVANTITPVKTIRVWADGTLTFTDESGKTTTAMPVLASELVPIYGRLINVSSTVNISLLR